MSKIVNISEAVSIAIYSMAVIAHGSGKVNGVQVCELTGFSRNHTAKILQLLAKHNFLKSERGPKGGFELNSPAENIYLIDIYKLVEGSYPENSHCLHNRDHCPFEKCVYGGIANDFSQNFLAYLSGKSLADIELKNTKA
jgi:Rrf2 family iron-sulfur cluster assembly transcriptional regulator